MRYVLAAALSGGISLAGTGAALAWLRRRGVLDRPNARSSHSVPVPRGGGAGPALAAIVTFIVLDRLPVERRLWLAAGLAAFAIVGGVEDLAGIAPPARLVLHAASAAAVVTALAPTFGFSMPLTVAAALLGGCWLVAFVNAFNFMDGIDGISAAGMLGAGAVWWLVGAARHLQPAELFGAIALGGAVGFAPWNAWRARVFPGDVGAYFWGAFAGTAAIVLVASHVAPEAALAPLVPLVADTFTTFVKRAHRREHLFEAHRSHAYQRLVQLGWPHVAVTGLYLVLVLACGALGLVSLNGAPTWRAAADTGILVVTAAYLLLPGALSRRVSAQARTATAA